MKKFGYYILFASLLLFVSSCRKDSQIITVQGRVTNFHTGLPIENASVFIGAWDTTSWCATADPIVTVMTDKDGYYKTSFADPGARYKIDFDVFKDSFFSDFFYGEIDLSKHQTDFTINRQLKPQTGILFKVEDVKPFDYIRNFELKYQFDTGFYSVGFVPLTYLQDRAGKAQEFIFAPGNKFTKIEYKYEQGPETITVKDSVFCPEFETTTYIIER